MANADTVKLDLPEAILATAELIGRITNTDALIAAARDLAGLTRAADYLGVGTKRDESVIPALAEAATRLQQQQEQMAQVIAEVKKIAASMVAPQEAVAAPRGKA